MKVLGIESSSLVASVALVTDDILTAEYTVNFKKTHSQTLLPMLDEIVKMLGLALKKPLIHVPTVDAIAYNMWGASGLICPIMDAKRCQVYTGLYHMENGMEIVREQCPMDMGELISQLNKQSERVIFLGDGVPVYQGMIQEKMTVPYVFAPAQMNRQRASCVAALGMKALNESYTGVKVQPADEFVPDYLRKSQAERQREAENSPDGQAGKLPGDY